MICKVAMLCRSLVEQFLGDIAAILSDLLQHSLVKPDVHFGIIAAHQVRWAAELRRQFLACGQARVDVQGFHQIDDRFPPIEVFALFVVEFLED